MQGTMHRLSKKRLSWTPRWSTNAFLDTQHGDSRVQSAFSTTVPQNGLGLISCANVSHSHKDTLVLNVFALLGLGFDDFSLTSYFSTQHAARTCGEPVSIMNGFVEGDCHHYECKVSYQCQPGFELVGKSDSVCQSNGTWSPTSNVPSCVRK